jgi:transposase
LPARISTGENSAPYQGTHNNIAENAMRKIALGRRNYLFAGSDSGGERAASIYTLVATARLNGVNPEAYLKDILTKSPTGIPSTGSTS